MRYRNSHFRAKTNTWLSNRRIKKYYFTKLYSVFFWYCIFVQEGTRRGLISIFVDMGARSGLMSILVQVCARSGIVSIFVQMDARSVMMLILIQLGVRRD